MLCEFSRMCGRACIRLPLHASVCMRVRSFVRAFLRVCAWPSAQTWVNKLSAAEKCGNKLEAEVARARVVLYDSLQVRPRLSGVHVCATSPCVFFCTCVYLSGVVVFALSASIHVHS
jgi:hypothetical protein